MTIDNHARISSFGCYMKEIDVQSTRPSGHGRPRRSGIVHVAGGTRHAALRAATKGRRNIAIAISSDGAITLFRDGEARLRLE